MSIDDALVMILAGGEGKRLFPLTQDRAKPAVPFGGRYRIVDFVINNFINSGFFKIKVLTQYKSDSLNKHITRGWTLSPFLNQYVDLAPAQMRTGGSWYKGTADAIYQNIFHINDEDPDYVCVFGGDHIYDGTDASYNKPERIHYKSEFLKLFNPILFMRIFISPTIKFFFVEIISLANTTFTMVISKLSTVVHICHPGTVHSKFHPRNFDSLAYGKFE